MDNAQDVIKFALDNMGREVELLISPSDGNAWTRYGTVNGVGSMGDQATITILNYRSEQHGDYIVKRTLVDVAEIIDISLAS